MTTEKDHLKTSPLSDRQLLEMIASNERQQAEHAYQEFISRYKDDIYEACNIITAPYTNDTQKKLTYSLYAQLIIHIFDRPESFIYAIKNLRDKNKIRAAILIDMGNQARSLFKLMLKDKWSGREVKLESNHYKIDQQIVLNYQIEKDEDSRIPVDPIEKENAFKRLHKAMNTFSKTDRDFMIMMADPIANKRKHFPEIIKQVAAIFKTSESNVRKHKMRLITRLTRAYYKQKG
ncbi:MAG TPA: hypothetical protein PLC47_05580 [Bacteroidales bacterium]|jgi:hypothetical protein|nr:hypothetical protein [Bacteroidales bacterium]HOI32217.1 hypothetical protein [Bacteroidales bacterium]